MDPITARGDPPVTTQVTSARRTLDSGLVTRSPRRLDRARLPFCESPELSVGYVRLHRWSSSRHRHVDVGSPSGSVIAASSSVRTVGGICVTRCHLSIEVYVSHEGGWPF